MNKFLSHIEKKASAPKYSFIEKKAAFEQLLQHGYSFDEAIEAIEKEAGLLGEAGRVASQVAGKARTFATAAKADIPNVAGQAKSVLTGRTVLNGGRFKTNIGMGRGAAAKQLVGNRAVQAGAGAAAVAGAGGAAVGAAMGNKKKDD